MGIWLLLGIVLVAALMFGAILRVNSDSRSACGDSDPARVNASMAACTRLIDWAFWLDDTDLAIVFANRGYAYDDVGDYARAIADYDVSLQLVPDVAVVLNNRGLSYGNMDNFGRAVADYDRSLKVEPGDSTVYSNRARAYVRIGKIKQAMDDYDAALRLDPENINANSDRGLAHFFQSDWKKSSVDIGQAITIGGVDPYRSLWRALALARGGESWQALLTADASHLDLTEWPGPVVRFLLGEIPEAQVLSEAWHEEPRLAKQRQCEAYFYLGQQALIRGEAERARDLFEKSVAEGVPDFLEYRGARVELLRM